MLRNSNGIVFKVFESNIVICVFLFFSFVGKVNANTKNYKDVYSIVLLQKKGDFSKILSQAKYYQNEGDYEASNKVLITALPDLENNEMFLNLGYVYYLIGDNYLNLTQLDLALKYHKIAEQVYDKTSEVSKEKIRNLLNLSRLYILKSRYNKSRFFIGKAEKLADGNVALEAPVFSALSEFHMFQNNYDASLLYLSKTLELYKFIGNKDRVLITKLNMLRLYVDTDNFRGANAILERLNEVIDKPLYLYYLNVYKAKLFLKSSDIINAIKYNDIAIAIKESNNIGPYYDAVYHQKAAIYDKLGEPEKAILILESYIEQFKAKGMLSCLNQTYEELTNYSIKIRDFERSYKYQKEHMVIQDSLFKIEKKRNANFYKTEVNLERANAKLNTTNLELGYIKEKRKMEQTLNILLFSALVLLLLFVYYALARQHKLRKLEYRILKAEAKALEQELEFKKSQILDFSAHIKEKNILLESIKGQIKKINTNGKNLQSILSKIRASINNDIQSNKKQISLYIQLSESNNNFFEKIEKDYPKFTIREKQIVQLLRLDMTSKEIASQLNLSVVSIDTYRSKIRHKFNLPKNEKLSSFIRDL